MAAQHNIFSPTTTTTSSSALTTMGLGGAPPTNIIGNTNNNNTNTIVTPPSSSADVSSVLAAIQAVSSHEASIRRPAEQILQQWEDAYSNMMRLPAPTTAAGYLTSLICIIGNDYSSSTNAITTSNTIGGGGGGIDENTRLLSAILLKNCIPKAFSIPLLTSSSESSSNPEVGGGGLGSNIIIMNNRNVVYQERIHVRNQLPILLFRERNDTIALHLQLALSNIALCDFPNSWPTLLEDLVSVASSSSSSAAALLGGTSQEVVASGMAMIDPSFIVRIRAIKTLRLCLQSIRQRKVIVQKGGGVGGGGGSSKSTILNMRDLGSLISKAVHERKEMHHRACSIFEALALGIDTHAPVAIVGGDSYSTWKAESILSIGYIKCMTELLPMIEIEDSTSDPRVPAVRQLLRSLVQLCDAVKSYPATTVPASLVGIPDAQQQYTKILDKIYRAALLGCISSVRSMPQLFAWQLSYILPMVVEGILSTETSVLQSMPVKRLMYMTSLIRVIIMCGMYDRKRKDSQIAEKTNAVLAALSGKGEREISNDSNPCNDPGVIEAQETVAAVLGEGILERLCEALVGKFLRLQVAELEEWEIDPEGRYETDLAEKSVMEANSPRHCGGALLLTLMNRETDRVAQILLTLTQRAHQQHSPEDVDGILNREACYRSLEICHTAMVGGGKRRLNFSDWFRGELCQFLQTDLGENAHFAMKAMQARAVQVVQAYSTSLEANDFGLAFQSIARLIAAQDLVTAFCAAQCINNLALLHVKGTAENAELLHVREHSVLALGNAFALANRSESEECLRVVLMCVSALVEANGVHLESVLQAIAEQLPPLWERARESVPIHSCLLSVLNHLIMKMGYGTVENSHIQKVLFPLLDYCTDISVVNRAETLLEDGLRLWLVTLVSSRVASMGPSLNNMMPRLEAILRSGLETHLALKTLQYTAILLGPQVVEPLAPFLGEMLINLTSCIHSEGDTAFMDGSLKGTDLEATAVRGAIAALSFAEGIMQLCPDLGLLISAPAISKVIAAVPRKKVMAAPLMEAAFASFGRMLWLNPNCLDDIFSSDQNGNEELAFVVDLCISTVTAVPFVVMLSTQIQKVVFINQKGASLSLCSAACRSPRVARLAGQQILDFTRRLLEVESNCKELDLDALVDAACGTARKVVGDGPLGDSANRMSAMLKSDPLLTVSLKDALENVEKAVANSNTNTVLACLS